MFKTRKTLEIEYNPTSQELEHLQNTAELIENLMETLEEEREEAVYFNNTEYSIESIRTVYFLLNDMLEQRYSSNILGE